MRLTFPPGESLLRLLLITPGNFGTERGTAELARPLALDGFTRLPYVPWSALKGVVSAAAGSLTLGGRPAGRARLFGGPDEEADEEFRPGAPGCLRLGDGEMLGFPLALVGGEPCLVVASDLLERLGRLGLGSPIEHPPPDRGWGAELSARDLGPAAGRLVPAKVVVDLELVGRLAGGSSHGQLVVAGRQAAGELFQAATERRAQTALMRGSKAVKAGSLRRVELVPAGSVFLSLVTNREGEPVGLELPEQLQLGAWEASGSGFVEAAVVEPEALAASEPSELAPEVAVAAEHDVAVMARMHQALAALSSRPGAGALRSVIYDLGPRLRRQGLPKMVAFLAAKAALGEPAPAGAEPQAHRRVLELLLGESAGAEPARLRRRAAELAGGLAPPPPELAARILWLRRHAEVLLRRGDGAADGEAR